jgi:hypothetical protein
MTTYFQSITIEFPTSEKTFFGMELAPICPSSLKAEEGAPFIVMKNHEDAIVIWWNNGIIVKGYKDGLTKTWYPKPTLTTALKYSNVSSNKGAYFEFHKDGSVTSTVERLNYYWSPPLNGKAETGSQVFGYLYDENEYSDSEIEQRSCGLCEDTAF